MRRLSLAANFAILLVWCYMIGVCPYTKVEESFNVQAIHDLVYHGKNISQYDHLEFPGVVPRTFFGPVVIKLIYQNFMQPVSWMKIVLSKETALIFVRVTLCICVFLCFSCFTHEVRKCLGKNVLYWFVFISCSQFHFNFYASRPLANTFAIPFVVVVYALYMKAEYKPAIWFGTVSVLVFRSELRKLGLVGAVAHGFLAAVVALGITVPMDSFFWQRLVWPEGEVWWYNVILNKSHNWGTQPFLWYFYSALPRALGTTGLLVPLGVKLEPRVRPLAVSAFVFIVLYSFLPHKELRFILYTVPALNLPAATVCSRIWLNRKKSVLWKLALLVVVGQITVNFVLSAAYLMASKQNYPGATALAYLHNKMERRESEKIRVHIDVFSAQNGVSRWLHRNAKWE